MEASNAKQPPISPRMSIYRWRLTMLSSIAHRGSGLLLLLAIPAAFLLILMMSHGMIGFVYGMSWLHHPVGAALLWATCTTLTYHMANGIRFLCLDAGWGESRDMMRLSAKFVWVTTIMAAALLAVML